jgi:HAD superfamily hydrolase (TIGR01458 family)
VLLDLDGVLYVGAEPLAGARQAVERLRQAGMPMRFVTNTTRRPRRVIREAVAAMGFQIEDGDLFTPAAAARDLLAANGLSPYLLIHPALAEDFAGLPPGEDAVVVGDAGDEFTYANLNRAFRLVMGGAPLLALAANRYFREPDGLSLDVGAFVAALEFATGARARVLGKPEPAFYAAAVAALGCPIAEAAMIGDDVEADVNGAIAAGLSGILVRTGKFRTGDEARLDPGALAFDDIAAAIGYVLACA